MEKTIFAFICPNCHKPITSRLEKFKCWYCNTYFEDTKAWEIKEMPEWELNALQGRSDTPIVAPITTPISAASSTSEMLTTLNAKPWEFTWSKLASTWQAVIAILAVVCVLAIFIDPTAIGTAQTIVGLLIGWFWTGPWCWKIAYEKGRNQTWAFAIGLFFAIPGAIIYWIYLLFHKQVNNIPIQ